MRSLRKSHLLALAGLTAALALATSAHAQPTSTSTSSSSPAHEVAAAAFEQARHAIDAGDCAAALPKLEESLKAEPSIGAHLSYADCFESIDPYTAFWHLRDAALIAFLRHDDRHASTEKRASTLINRIASVRVSTNVTDLEASDFQLRIDGKLIDRFHLTGPLGLRPGDHTLSATTSDGRRWEKRITAENGKIIAVDVQLQEGGGPLSKAPAVVPQQPEPKASSSSRGSTQRTIGVIVAAVGVGTIAAGAAFGVVTIARRNDLDRACNGSVDNCTGSSRVINPILVSAENSATASTILFTTGAAVLAGGIVLWLLAPSSSSSSSSAKTGLGTDRSVFRW